MSCTLAVLFLVMSPESGVYQWEKLPREPIKTIKKYLGFPASVCSSMELQTEQNWLPVIFTSYLVFMSSSATTSSLRLSLSTPVYCALSPCELHTGCRWVFDFRESFHVFSSYLSAWKRSPWRMGPVAHSCFPHHLPQSLLSVNI